MPGFPCKFPRFAVKVLMNRTTCEIPDYYSEIKQRFENKLCKTKDLSSVLLLKTISVRAAAR